MAEAVRKSKLEFLKLFAKIFASILSLLGILSSCGRGETMAPYGVEGVYIHGKTISSADSSSIAGIQIKLSSPDSTIDFAEATSDSDGRYLMFADANEITLPDSVRLTAADIDGAENGSFASKDTLLFLEEDQYYDIDFFLQEDNE